MAAEWSEAVKAALKLVAELDAQAPEVGYTITLDREDDGAHFGATNRKPEPPKVQHFRGRPSPLPVPPSRDAEADR